MKVIIVGGVAGGATAAARIRRLDEKAEIVIFERTGFISYANCGLPYFIGDVINDPDDLTLQSPAGFFRRFRINAKIHHEVVAINPDSKTVTVKNLESESFLRRSMISLFCLPVQSRFCPKLKAESEYLRSAP